MRLDWSSCDSPIRRRVRLRRYSFAPAGSRTQAYNKTPPSIPSSSPWNVQNHITRWNLAQHERWIEASPPWIKKSYLLARRSLRRQYRRAMAYQTIQNTFRYSLLLGHEAVVVERKVPRLTFQKTISAARYNVCPFSGRQSSPAFRANHSLKPITYVSFQLGEHMGI